MPFKSAKQRRLIYAVAGSSKVAKKVGISMKTARKMIAHSKRRKK